MSKPKEIKIKQLDDLIGVLCKTNNPWSVYDADFNSYLRHLIPKNSLYFIKSYEAKEHYKDKTKIIIHLNILLLNDNSSRRACFWLKTYRHGAIIGGHKTIEERIDDYIKSNFIPFSRYVSGGAPKNKRTIGTQYNAASEEQNKNKRT